MSQNRENGQTQPPGLNLADIYHILFRHKWKILFFSVAGFVAAAFIYVTKPPLYTSAAKLYVRYVPDERMTSGMGNEVIRNPDPQGQNIINSEVEIITSLDIAQEVVTNIGAEKILAREGGGTNRNLAVAILKKNLTIDLPKHSDVIKIIFQHKDKDLVQPILSEVIAAYMRKHSEIHTAVPDDILTNQIVEVRGELARTEESLRAAKASAGITDLEGAKRSIAERRSSLRSDILNAKADLAQHEATLKEIARLSPGAPDNNTNANTQMEAIPGSVARDYKNVSARLEILYAKDAELSASFTTNTPPVKEVRQQIADGEVLKKSIEDKYPRLTMVSVTVPVATTSGRSVAAALDPAAEAIQVQALKARIDFLGAQFATTENEAARVEKWEGAIVELQRQKEMLEGKYRSFSSSLEQSHFKSALEGSKLSNINIAQEPSPPYRDAGPLQKLLGIALAGGVVGGIALAFLIEMFLDQTVRRPIDVETRLRLPLFLTIPDTTRNSRHLPARKVTGRLKAPGEPAKAEANGNGSTNGHAPKSTAMEIALWDNNHALRPFFEVLRDKLVNYFDANNLKHKPKLVAVTACKHGAGVTTIAAGLAATLSETGEGNVLLVDMNQGQGASQPYFKGKPACSVAEALQDGKKGSAMVQENLYVATEETGGDKLPSLLPSKFSHLVPQLRASDYDYIIFDMPTVSQISVTTKLARLMDVSLMVVESEKTNRDLVRQAAALVSAAKSNVAVVLNKRRIYVPQWLHQEL